MAEAGSFADRVKQQADIVRVVGEYVRLKKSGANFTGLCPFHAEKSPSFAVHPTKQIYHCFGCGVGGDVFKFVMEMEKCAFPEAIRIVAEKCGIAIPRPKERSPEERKENQQRAVLVEMHREAQSFFVKQLEGTLEGKAARAYLEDRGLDKETISRFGIGYAPSGGDMLLRHLKIKYSEKFLVESGLISRDQNGGRLFDRFRRRITFPIANESAKIVAFGARALGDDQPKYLNSPETPIYSKSNVLYHLDRAKDALRRQDFAILVEGYMDAIAVARAGFGNVVASCGTALAESQIKLLGRFTKRVVVNYDPDVAGQAATERSLSALLEQDFEVRVLALPAIGDKKADPDLFIREKGAEGYQKQLKEAPPYVDYLIGRARQMDLTTGEGKLRAVNFLLPYVQRVPNRILRSEWATRIAQQLRLEEPVLRAALSKAAAERRSEVKTQPELVGRSAKQVERRLIRMLAEAEDFRRELAQQLQNAQLYHGLETEKVFAALIVASLSGEPVLASEIGAMLEERDRRVLFEILFEEAQEGSWEEAQSCLEALARKQVERELADVQRGIEANPTGPAMRELLTKKQALMRRLAASG
ncbi:MAG TPA: DNA primase [Candidatus Sulfotelmatobacter sp.]|jgi:DNA primase|nr:DNA primase [Candidatus Sulfotelmatobacter sp.]